MLLTIMLFIGGSCLGSFLCVAAERIPTYRSLLAPRSHCLFCQKMLRFYELIPIISICIQKFRCRHCKKRIPLSYLIAEVFAGFITTLLFANGWSIVALYKWLFVMSTFTLALVDYWFLVVEPKILYPAYIVIVGLHIYLHQPLHLLTSFVIFSLLLIIIYFFPTAIGRGDVLLIGLWSYLFSWTEMMLLLFIASSCGLLFLCLYSFLKKRTLQRIPFVPFLFLGLLVCLYFY
jgi:leader peptidase (prepilin peptidase)/N-methyltransferase